MTEVINCTRLFLSLQMRECQSVVGKKTNKPWQAAIFIEQFCVEISISWQQSHHETFYPDKTMPKSSGNILHVNFFTYKTGEREGNKGLGKCLQTYSVCSIRHQILFIVWMQMGLFPNLPLAKFSSGVVPNQSLQQICLQPEEGDVTRLSK